ncbi:MAG: DUF3426 domain-containing protein [Pseudomonadota bacterium]
MIITCPNCATRYDVEDARFAENGRSVRCAVCETSWFVPAPEPIGNLVRGAVAPSVSYDAPDVSQEPEEDALFAPIDPDAASGDPSPRKNARASAEDEGGFFKRLRSREAEDGPAPDRIVDDQRAFNDSSEPRRRAGDVVDAAFEDVSGGETEGDGEFVDRRRGFGRRLRDQRRRSTALAPLDDIDETAERVFNDEFFTALRVQPRDLEKAIRKARRRAEARDKNRLTPWRAVGWSLWLGAIGAAMFVAFAYRQDIVNAWPEAEAAYAVIGVEAEAQGLKIVDVSHRFATSTLGPSIEISGVLFNNTGTAASAPLMQAEAFDADGALLARWTFELDVADLPAGERAPFQTRSIAPDGVAEIAISFAPEAPRPRVGPGSADA